VAVTSLNTAVAGVLETANQHATMNESNTRVLLIEPILDALGWNTRDLAVVTREVQVLADGTFIDYALLVDGSSAGLYVEAKALRAKLDDRKVVAQTVNYANNDGVPWCVLTDGIRWRVFWTIAPVAMDRKGVFDIDLSVMAAPDATEDERRSTLRQLELLSRKAVTAGDLDERGRSLFDTQAVRTVLDDLFSDPPSELVAIVASRLPNPMDDERVAAAVARLGRPFLDSPQPKTEPPEKPSADDTAKRKKYARVPHTYDEHFGTASAEVVDLYQRLHEAVMAKGDRIVRTYKAKAVNYAIDDKHIFVTVVPQASRLKLFLALPGSRADGHPDLRDMTGIGHHGHGDVEAPLTSENFNDRLALIDEALATFLEAGHPASDP
jgi:predicted transport protein